MPLFDPNTVLENVDNVTIIGWDVGGIMGKNHGLCFATYTNGQFAYEEPVLRSLAEVINTIVTRDYGQTNVLLAIDAPFGFPDAFITFIGNHGMQLNHDNVRFRQTELFVRRLLSIRPLSASLDYFTNNTLAALSAIHNLNQHHNFIRIPTATPTPAQRVIIEVFPKATIKSALGNQANNNIPKVARYGNYLNHLGWGNLAWAVADLAGTPSYDRIDALICCITGAEFLQTHCYHWNAQLINQPDVFVLNELLVNPEGWIFVPHNPANPNAPQLD